MKTFSPKLSELIENFNGETFHADDFNQNGFSEIELSCAFDMVKNQDNWKEPIIADIHADDFKVVRVAVIFYTGSVTEQIGTNADGSIRIFAEGYYNAIGC